MAIAHAIDPPLWFSPPAGGRAGGNPGGNPGLSGGSSFFEKKTKTASQGVTLKEGKVSRQGQQGYVRDAEGRSAGLSLTLNIPPCLSKKKEKGQHQGQYHRSCSKHALPGCRSQLPCNSNLWQSRPTTNSTHLAPTQ